MNLDWKNKTGSITAYFSHSIRGKKGKDATDEEVAENCHAAIKVAEWIREVIPELDLYVPAEHEDFVHITYRDKYLTEDQILEIDCKILERKDFHIVYEVGGWLGGGIAKEIEAAKKYGKSIFYISKLDDFTAGLLIEFVQEMKASGK